MIHDPYDAAHQGEKEQLAMARPANGTNFSISQLEQILQDRRQEVKRLNKQRADAQRKLDAIDRQIEKLGGSTGGRRGGRGSRPRNDKPLPDVMEAVLKAHGKPMRVNDIVEGVLSSGYRSGSANFKGIVNQQLIKDKRFGATERGIYQLKK
jgi:hypothetical protein